jgi:hypothetical protein
VRLSKADALPARRFGLAFKIEVGSANVGRADLVQRLARALFNQISTLWRFTNGQYR